MQSPNPTNQAKPLIQSQLDRFVGLAMLILASTVFAYYTIWTLLMVLNHSLDVTSYSHS